jgi:hypothetical protein
MDHNRTPRIVREEQGEENVNIILKVVLYVKGQLPHVLLYA